MAHGVDFLSVKVNLCDFTFVASTLKVKTILRHLLDFSLILASQCQPLPEVEHATANILAGRGLNYGTVIRYECDVGYQRTGLPVLICQSDGTWSSDLPTCTKKRCFTFPEIENGYIVDKSSEYYYGDQAKVECHRGYNRIGSNIINCGDDQQFTNLPKCEGKTTFLI